MATGLALPGVLVANSAVSQPAAAGLAALPGPAPPELASLVVVPAEAASFEPAHNASAVFEPAQSVPASLALLLVAPAFPGRALPGTVLRDGVPGGSGPRRPGPVPRLCSFQGSGEDLGGDRARRGRAIGQSGDLDGFDLLDVDRVRVDQRRAVSQQKRGRIGLVVVRGR